MSASPLGLGVGPPLGSSGLLNGPPPSSDQLLLTLRSKPHSRVFRALFQVQYPICVDLVTVSATSRFTERQSTTRVATESGRCGAGQGRDGLGRLFSRRNSGRSDRSCSVQLRGTSTRSSDPSECESPISVLSPHCTTSSDRHSTRFHCRTSQFCFFL